jgi:hypothetical protein
MPSYYVEVIVNTLELYRIEAENEKAAGRRWREGEQVRQIELAETRVRFVEEVQP